MRALSLWQPWASLIAFGEKTYETRHWQTKYRGPLLIHAAKTREGYRALCGRHASADVLTGPGAFVRSLESCGVRRWADLPLGAFVAVVDLVDIIPTNQLAIIGSKERAFGDYSQGRFAWRLENLRALSAPLPGRGRQGLWTPDAALVDEALSYVQQPLPLPEVCTAGEHCQRGGDTSRVGGPIRDEAGRPFCSTLCFNRAHHGAFA